MKKGSKIMQVVLVLIYLVLTISGLVLMKKGGNPGSIALESGNINFGMSLISLAGFVCYICSFLLFTRIVVMFDMSYIMPICTGIVQILSLIAAKLIFKEEITLYGVIGAILVIIGIIVMNIKTN